MLDGKRVVVLGGSGGIGQAITRACFGAGATVGVHANERVSEAERLAAEGNGCALAFDVRDPLAAGRGLEHFRERYGGLDVLVNAVGVHEAELVVASEPARLRHQVEVNLLGVIFCTRAALELMLRQRSGVIINLSSVAAEHPIQGGAAYAATKAGVEAFTRAVALEYGRKGIRALCVRPGPVDTAMLDAARALAGEGVSARTALRRLGRAEEVASLVAFLASDQASYVTGSVHAIDGGFA